jgi:hypothetical protein
VTLQGIDGDSILWRGTTSNSGTICGGSAYDSERIDVRANCASGCSGQLPGGQSTATVTICRLNGGVQVFCMNAKSDANGFHCRTGGGFITTGLTNCCTAVDDTQGSAIVT